MRFSVPVYTLVGVNGTSKAKPVQAALQLGVTSSSDNADQLEISLEVTTYLATSLASPHRQVGAGVWMDDGDGELARVVDADLDGAIEMQGSLDGFGRSLTVKRQGLEQAPPRSAILRSQRRAQVQWFVGMPGQVQSRMAFDGYLRAGTFDGNPPVAQLEFQDASLKYSELTIAYTLEPGLLKTRKQILIEVLTLYAVPYAMLDLGPNDGGVVFKGISEGGTTRLLDWIRDFLGPTGARAYFRPDGRLHVERFTPETATPVRTLRMNDIRRVSIAPSETNAPNQVVISSTIFDYIGVTGLRTEVTDEVVRGTYTPAAAVKKQSKIDGSIATVSITPSAVGVTGRKRTTTVRDGGTIVSRDVEEWGWYAAKACNRRQDSDGSTSFNNQFDVYLYGDGTWRTDLVESFQVIRRTHLRRFFDDNTGFLAYETFDVNKFVGFEIQTGHRTAASTDDVFAEVLTTDDGVAWYRGREVLSLGGFDAFYRILTGYSVDDATGAILSTSFAHGLTFDETAQLGEPIYFFRETPSGAVDEPVYFFGRGAERRFTFAFVLEGDATLPIYAGGNYTISNTPLSEESFSQTTTVVKGNGQIINGNIMPAVPSSDTHEVSGALPLADRATSRQVAQPATLTFTDTVRAALNNGHVVTEYLQNEFCETVDELRTAALERLRELTATTFTIEMPIDATIEETKTIVLDIPELGEPVRLGVWGMSWSYNASPDSFSAEQVVTAKHFPAELAV